MNATEKRRAHVIYALSKRALAEAAARSDIVFVESTSLIPNICPASSISALLAAVRD